MRLYLDLDTRGFVESETFARPITALALKRGDNVPVDLYFVRGNKIQELAEGATGKIGIKPKGQFGSAFYLAMDEDWEKSGSGDNTRYSLSLNLNTTEMESAFLAEPASVLAMLEVEWVESGLRTSSATLDVEIQNDVNRGTEGVPTDAMPPYPASTDLLTKSADKASQAEAEAGLDNSRWMSPLRVAQAIAALGEGGGAPGQVYKAELTETENLHTGYSGLGEEFPVGFDVILRGSAGEWPATGVYSVGNGSHPTLVPAFIAPATDYYLVSAELEIQVDFGTGGLPVHQSFLRLRQNGSEVAFGRDIIATPSSGERRQRIGLTRLLRLFEGDSLAMSGHTDYVAYAGVPLAAWFHISRVNVDLAGLVSGSPEIGGGLL